MLKVSFEGLAFMSLSPLSWAGIVAGVLLLMVILLLVRRRRKRRARMLHTRLPVAAVRFAVPSNTKCCDQAQQHLNICYARDESPTLPLSGCSMRRQCRCYYAPILERRLSPDRRSGHDRRGNSLRGDKEDRRNNQGRRKTDKSWRG